MSGFLVKTGGVFVVSALVYFLVMRYVTTASFMVGTSSISFSLVAFLLTGVFLWFGVKVKS